jgi:superfamily II DNA helicase RecQ
MSAREAAASGVENAGADLDNALERLAHLWGFATGARCRHKTLCEYFGQPFTMPSGGCGACDVCLGEIQEVLDGRIVAQKILSCVVRCGQRFGAQHVSDVLRGAQTAKIRQTGHDGLSTFGLLSASSNHEVRSWIDQLVGLGHLRVAEGQYPTLFLSKSGVEVMRGDVPIALYNPAAPKSKGRKRSTAAAALAAAREPAAGRAALIPTTLTPTTPTPATPVSAASISRASMSAMSEPAASDRAMHQLDPVAGAEIGTAAPASVRAEETSARDEALFESLRDLRREIARERGIPPYLVFNDRTLALFALHKPVTAEGFRAIKGVGDKKADDLGPRFLEAIAAHLRSPG